jgi:hypothetical protein
MTQTEALIASLNTADNRGVTLDSGHYIDWSTATDDGVVLEASDGEDLVQIPMTRDDVLALQQTLTAWLLTTQ